MNNINHILTFVRKPFHRMKSFFVITCCRTIDDNIKHNI